MHLSDRKAIALFISRIASEYQQDLIQHISALNAEKGYYTLVYPTFEGYGDNEPFVRGERYMVDLPCYEALSGIIVALDTFEEPVVEKLLMERIRERSTCPVVIVRSKVPGYHSILIDNENSMGTMVDHLVQQHGYRDFCYVSGPRNHPDAIGRLGSFLEACAAHDIVVGSDSIYYGNFWRNCGQKAVEELLEGRESYPDCIVCANDYMAISVMNALIDREIPIPSKIAVVGFDDISEAEAISPTLTTLRVDVQAMAKKAVETIFALIEGQEMPLEQFVGVTLRERQSCGCTPELNWREKAIHRYYQMYDDRNQNLYQSVFMGLEGGNSEDFEMLNKIVYRYVFNNLNFQDYYIALYQHDFENGSPEEFHCGTDAVTLKTVIQRKLFLGQTTQVFPAEWILPAEWVHEAPCAYVILPLHYQEQLFGYSLIRYGNGQISLGFLQYFTLNIESVIENIRAKKQLRSLIRKYQDLYAHDVLTGLYNRRGFEEMSQAMYRDAVQQERTLCVASIDMDGLKVINDTFGHAAGDQALRVISEIIVAAGAFGEQFFRVGGDEFYMLGIDYTEEMVSLYQERLDEYLEHYNKRDGLSYRVQASFGYELYTPEKNQTLQELLTKSDAAMYEQKEQRRADRRILVDEGETT